MVRHSFNKAMPSNFLQHTATSVEIIPLPAGVHPTSQQAMLAYAVVWGYPNRGETYDYTLHPTGHEIVGSRRQSGRLLSMLGIESVGDHTSG